MIFARSATRFATRIGAAPRSAFLSTKAVRSNNDMFRRAMPLVAAAGGLTIAGVTYQTNVDCDSVASAKSVQDSIKQIEDKFATYWPRNIMVRLESSYFIIYFLAQILP